MFSAAQIIDESALSATSVANCLMPGREVAESRTNLHRR